MSANSEHPASKKRKLNMKIGTHNGTFHCDEALGVWMLQQTDRFQGAEIIRSRKEEILAECDIVLDVGAKFDHSALRYDHHQKEFKETYNSLDNSKPWKTKLSSAGLIYVYYGREVIKSVMLKVAESHGLSDDIMDDQVEIIKDKVYENLIEEVDAVDNGISATKEVPKYKITTTLSKRVAILNPRWNEPIDDSMFMERFKKAMEMVAAEFVDRVTYYQLSWLPAYALVKESIQKRFDIHKSGEVICLPGSGIPWKEYVLTIEEELDVEKPVKYVLYRESDVPSTKWRIQCVPLRADSFENRLSLPAKWRGLREERLSEASEISGCVFVHINGFIGGNDTFDGVLAMADKSLEMSGQ